MNGQIPTPPNTTQPIQPPSPKRGRLFEIFFVVIVLILVFGILNYFNILRLSEIFPNNLGFLPHRQVSNVTFTPPVKQSFPTFPPSPTDQAKQSLTNFLSTIIAPSLLPLYILDIELTPNKEAKERFFGSWVTKEGIARVNFDISSDSNKITSLEFRFQKIQPASPSVELAKSAATELFHVNPKGTWFCAQIATRTSYCENFWEEQSKDVKTGLGFQINSLSDTSARFIFSFCEHTKESNLYSWKSCRSEFAESGVR